MADVNPYEPPREMEPLTNAQIVKRSAGIGVILLLMPVAAGIAGFFSCMAHDAVPQTGDPTIALSVRPIVAVLPLLATLAGMSCWAIWLHHRNMSSPGRWSHFSTIMALTPLVVIAALGASYVATGVLIDAISELGTAILVGVLTFFGPPALALIGMLIAGWRMLRRRDLSRSQSPDQGD